MAQQALARGDAQSLADKLKEIDHYLAIIKAAL